MTIHVQLISLVRPDKGMLSMSSIYSVLSYVVDGKRGMNMFRLSLFASLHFFGLLVLVTFSREIEQEEFKKVMALMRSHNRQGSSHRDGLRIGLKVGGSVENGGLLEYFFGEDGNRSLHYDKFVQFLRGLHDEVLSKHFSFVAICIIVVPP